MVDFISHALWAFAVFHNSADAFAFAGFSLLPDLLWGVPAVFLFFLNGGSLGELRKMRRLPHESVRKSPYFSSVRIFYHASHSWLVTALASVAVYFLLPALAFPFTGGVFLHLAMDLFVHKDSVAGQLPLYPLSRFKVNGFFHWSNRKFLAFNYAALVIVYALIFAGVI